MTNAEVLNTGRGSVVGSEPWYDRFLRSYKLLRFTIGLATFGLPLTLLFWGLAMKDMAWFTDGVPTAPSLSAYYYTPARNVFIGVLWATGIFLIFHRGETKNGRSRRVALWGLIAGISAIVVASVPTGAPPELKLLEGTGATSPWGPRIHVLFAILFFSIMLVFSWRVFPRSGDPNAKFNNLLHLFFAAGIGIQMLILLGEFFKFYKLWYGALFWLEFGMLVLVGCSWLVEFRELFGRRAIANTLRRMKSEWKTPIRDISDIAMGRVEEDNR